MSGNTQLNWSLEYLALDSTVPLAVRVRVRAFAVVDDGKGREMRQWLPIRYGRKAPARNASDCRWPHLPDEILVRNAQSH